MNPTDYRMIAVSDLVPHPDNPRDLAEEDAQEMVDLANSIAKNGNEMRIRVVPITQGQHTGKFLLIEGHRRWTAAQLASVKELYAWVDPSLDTKFKQIKAMILENTHRSGLKKSREAGAIQAMLDCEGMSMRKVAAAIDRPESFVRRRSRLAGLPPVAHQLVDEGGLTLEQSDAFDEFKDDPDAYQELILMATNPNRLPSGWDRLVESLRTKRDAPAKKAEAQDRIRVLKVPVLDRNQTYSGHYNRDYRAELRTDQEHAAAGEAAFINETSGQIEWYRKSTTQATKAPLTEDELAERKLLKDLEAGLEQDLALWDEHLRRCLADAGGGLPLTPAEKTLQAGLAPLVLRSACDYQRAHELIGSDMAGSEAKQTLEAVAKLRPLQLAMLMVELNLRPEKLHKPGTWELNSWSDGANERINRWISVRKELFGYDLAVFETETVAHFTALASNTATTPAEDQEEDDDE